MLWIIIYIRNSFQSAQLISDKPTYSDTNLDDTKPNLLKLSEYELKFYS